MTENHNHTQDLQIAELRQKINHHLTVDFVELKVLLKEIQRSIVDFSTKHGNIKEYIDQKVREEVSFVERRLWQIIAVVTVLVGGILGGISWFG